MTSEVAPRSLPRTCIYMSAHTPDQPRQTGGEYAEHHRDEDDVTLQLPQRTPPLGTSKWHQSAASPDPGVREWVALWTVAQDVLNYLSTDPSDAVRSAVAINPETSKELLTVLCGDECSLVADTAEDAVYYLTVGASTGESTHKHRTRNRDQYVQLTGKRNAA